jgi:hypothetical protein
MISIWRSRAVRVVRGDIELFRFDGCEIDLSTILEIIPNLSDWGRVRGEFDVRLRRELVDDFFWTIEVYDSFDSGPKSMDADENDYGVVTGLLLDL